MNAFEEENWTSYSKHGAWQLCSLISERLFNLGIWNAPGGDHISGPYVQGVSFNIRFFRTSYGCEILGYIFKDDNSSKKLREFWQVLLKESLIWGESPKTKNDPSVDVLERQRKVKELHGSLTREQMADRLAVSIPTIARDIKALGLVKKNNKS